MQTLKSSGTDLTTASIRVFSLSKDCTERKGRSTRAVRNALKLSWSAIGVKLTKLTTTIIKSIQLNGSFKYERSCLQKPIPMILTTHSRRKIIVKTRSVYSRVLFQLDSYAPSQFQRYSFVASKSEFARMQNVMNLSNHLLIIRATQILRIICVLLKQKQLVLAKACSSSSTINTP